MRAPFILGLILLGAILWWLLERHESRRAASGKPRHSSVRLIPAAVALLAMLFSAGFTLLLLASSADAAPGVLIIGVPPFLGALLVWWLAMRRSRG